VADDFTLRKFKREAEVLLKALPHESTVLSAFIHIAALARDAAAVLDAIRVGNQRQFGKPSIDFRLNSATALFSVAEFDQFEEVIGALISDFPHDTDVAYVAWTSYVLMGMPRRALASIKVRQRANIEGECNEGNLLRDLESIVAFFDQQKIADEDATLIARPLLRRIAEKTHQIGNTTFSLQLDLSEQDSGTARLMLYPEVSHEQISELLNGYFDELGASSLPWSLLSSFSVDIYGIRREHAQLAA